MPYPPERMDDFFQQLVMPGVGNILELTKNSDHLTNPASGKKR
jgi:hypothetical protein